MSSAACEATILFWIFLKKWKISEIIQFFGANFLGRIQVVIILHKNLKQKSSYNYQFCSKDEKSVKIIAFSSSAGNQLEEGGSGFYILIGWERARERAARATATWHYVIR